MEFREVNSLELSKWEERFDLIWIDGAHGYPVVAMDVINSFRLASENGYVLIDDLRITGSDSHRMYKSVGGFESLQALVEAKLIPSFYLFYKRLSGVFNTPGREKVCRAICEKMMILMGDSHTRSYTESKNLQCIFVGPATKTT